MLFSKHKKSISDRIVYILGKKSLSGVELLDQLRLETSISKESVYRVLRELLNQEIINKVHKKYSLNRHWVQKLRSFSLEQTTKEHSINEHNILDFNDGDSISYQFKNADLMGIYWGHLYDYVTETQTENTLITVYHPHEWLIHARKESEEYVLNKINREKRLVLLSLGGHTELDKKFKKEWSSDYLKINTNVSVTGLKPNRYINVLGDFIFEVRTTLAFEKSIDEFYQRNNSINQSNLEKLKEIVNEQYTTKLIFSRNRKKAALLRKKLSKDFYIPEKYRT